ncbi:MAG: hypothetical protein M3R72_10415 [Bacteroidota bacterium]|nr:hypothetical protein [Bacteroidota bacterium]
MKVAFVIVLLLFITDISAQPDSGKVILDRKLSWSDFTGEVDKSSAFSAMTYWSINYSYQARWHQSDTAYVTFTIHPRFESKSWVKRNLKSDELLQHEQGHYDLAIICAEMLKGKFSSYTFFKEDYTQKIDSIFQSTHQLIKQIELQYDTETNHMLNREEQKQWNSNIRKLLEKVPDINHDR